MTKKTDKLFNRIYAPAKLSAAGIAVTIGAFAIDSYTMIPTFQALLQSKVVMIMVLVLGMALAMETSPNILAILLKKRDKAAGDYLMMLVAAGIFLLVSAANLVVKLGTMEQMFADTKASSYTQTVLGTAAEAFRPTQGQLAMTLIQALIPVMTSVLVFIIGISQDTGLLEQKKRLAFLKAASEELGRIEGELAALDQKLEGDPAADLVRGYFAEERSLCDNICDQLKREALHLIASKVPDRAEALSNLQGKRRSDADSAGAEGPAKEASREEYQEAPPEEFPEEEDVSFEKEHTDPFHEDFPDESEDDKVCEEDFPGGFSEKVPGERYHGRPGSARFRTAGEIYPDEVC